MWLINIYISSRLWVKQITLHNLGGPHQFVEGLKRRTWNLLKKLEFCLQTTCGLKTEHQLVWELPDSQTPLQASDLPVPTASGADSLKLPPFVPIHTHTHTHTHTLLALFLWRTLIQGWSWTISSPSLPSILSVMRANQCFFMSPASTLSLSPPTPSCFRLSASLI